MDFRQFEGEVPETALTLLNYIVAEQAIAFLYVHSLFVCLFVCTIRLN